MHWAGWPSLTTTCWDRTSSSSDSRTTRCLRTGPSTAITNPALCSLSPEVYRWVSGTWGGEERRESSQVKFLFAYWAVQWSWIARVNNNNNGHFYGAWSLARSRTQCAVQKSAEKCINTYNGQNKKGFRPYDRQPRKNVHTISVNKPKLSVTFITFITVMLYHRRVCSFCARTENHRWICRFCL